MKREIYTIEKDGFCGAFYPHQSDKAMILMLGDSSTDRLASAGAKWLAENGIAAMAMSPDVKDYGHHNYPLERFEKAIRILQEKGYQKIGICGASTTGMLALTAASYYPEITMTVAMSPSDFVMEGFIRDGKDGAEERPADGESSVSYSGEPLPYLPYAYRHPEYWQKLKEEAKQGKDMAAARKMFDLSEKLHPLQEEEMIRIEKIRGKLVLIGAEDDVLWDTCRYIRRMAQRLKEKPHACRYEALLYRWGTHFVFPYSMARMLVPVFPGILVRMFASGRKNYRECIRTQKDIDERLRAILHAW